MHKYLILIFGLLFCVSSTTHGKNIDNMPIVKPVPLDKPVEKLYGAPLEQRGEEYRKYLSPSLKISVAGSAGSGTIVFYDKETNTAYVASCGHLWSPGGLNAEQAKNKKLKCKVVTWYHNDVKLKETKSYEAEVLFYSFVEGCDTSLISFKPDWEPKYFPIAPKEYLYKAGTFAHSVG